ncbi:MAG: GNAT family N-acetyltransferase [Pseudonocardiaceae bacterium]
MEGLRPSEAEVGLVPASASSDVTLVDGLTALVNEVYAVAEEGLWLDGVARTTSTELAGLIRASELAVARREGAIVGCVRVQRLDGDRGEFGMLAAKPAQRGTGVGRALLRFAEELSAARGLRMMQLELLVPRDWTHPSKTFLEGWYTRSGYRLIRTDRPEDAFPHLAPHLATACDYRIYHKALPPRPCPTRQAGKSHFPGGRPECLDARGFEDLPD